MTSLFDLTTSAQPAYVPNLTLWYRWHSSRGTLPEPWQSFDLKDVCDALGVPAWDTARGYRQENGGVSIVREETESERIISYRTTSVVLTERWQLGPDGDWWQVEYPVKSSSDLDALAEIALARSYEPDASKVAALRRRLGDNGIVGLELPRRPFSQLFLEWLGWGDGLMLLFDQADLIAEILTAMEAKLQALVQKLAQTADVVFVSPDNLDSQFISPGFFRQYLAGSYRRTADILHEHGGKLLVDTGGPIRQLLPLLAESGVNAIQGVSGPPQCDASLSEARALTHPQFTLWGGIAQDVLLDEFPYEDFEEQVRSAAHVAKTDRHMILGVADRVPIDANLDRLAAISEIISNEVRRT
ncbi:MAG: hypothetical protein J5I90_14010 [Caldilineales bacterium]|nr:hypothetical protein [Caldilineales bacterium]